MRLIKGYKGFEKDTNPLLPLEDYFSLERKNLAEKALDAAFFYGFDRPKNRRRFTFVRHPFSHKQGFFQRIRKPAFRFRRGYERVEKAALTSVVPQNCLCAVSSEKALDSPGKSYFRGHRRVDP